MNEELDSETSGAKPGRPARLQMPVVKLGTPIHSPDFPPDASKSNFQSLQREYAGAVAGLANEVDAANALVAMSGKGNVEAAKALLSLNRGGSGFPSEQIKPSAYDPRSRDGRDGR